MPELPVSESATCFFDLIELNVLLIFGIMFRKRIGRAGRHPQIMPHVISATLMERLVNEELCQMFWALTSKVQLG
jgi:hypothetical protein